MCDWIDNALSLEEVAMEFAGNAVPLSQPGLNRIMGLLGVGAAEIWTVVAVETRGCGFLADRRPRILFERHIFHQRTNGAHDTSNPALSSALAGGYLGGEEEYDRLHEAMKLDRDAALKSTSWGLGQVMGFNSMLAGYVSVDLMVKDMVDREDAQLTAMANFLKARRLDAALASHDWTQFAKGYNGAEFKRNQYDTRLASAYRAFAEGPLPDLSVRQAQTLLMYLGLDPGAIDGLIGKRTRSAIVRFREEHGLRLSDDIDDEFLASLVTVAGQGATA
jgi:N-acetylmuramidase-like protein/putative peptidoglycan binding protein